MSAAAPSSPRPPRVLELYAGIGGCAAALDPRVEVVAAVDVNRRALEVYRRNFPHPTLARSLESLNAAELRRFEADLWWLSPPCQPFTRRGLGRDDADPRAASLLHLIAVLEEAAPAALALENVPGFASSRCHARLRAALERLGYQTAERLLCPTELGVANRRRRFYLVAARGPLRHAPARPAAPRSVASCLDPHPAPELWPAAGLVARYRRAIDLVDPADPVAVAACFTAAYGRSPVRSGSYLATESGPRRFAPAEILRLLGFPATYSLPPGMPARQAWRLVGNSLSVDAVRTALAMLPLPLAPAARRLVGEGIAPSRPRASAAPTPPPPARPPAAGAA